MTSWLRNVIIRPEDCELVERAGDAIRDDCLDEVHLDVIVGVVGVLIDDCITLLFSLSLSRSFRWCSLIIVSTSCASSSINDVTDVRFAVVVVVGRVVEDVRRTLFFVIVRLFNRDEDDEDESAAL